LTTAVFESAKNIILLLALQGQAKTKQPARIGSPCGLFCLSVDMDEWL
jgi:hypothetical protein